MIHSILMLFVGLFFLILVLYGSLGIIYGINSMRHSYLARKRFKKELTRD